MSTIWEKDEHGVWVRYSELEYDGPIECSDCHCLISLAYDSEWTVGESKCYDCLDTEVEILRFALERSVWLQSHYAELLNSYDGGERIIFKNKEEWIARLKELKELPS